MFLSWCWVLIYALLPHSDIIEYSLPKLLEKLQIDHNEVRLIINHTTMLRKHCTQMSSQTCVIFFLQFIDLCILLGCDYCDKIAGLGPKRALTLIQKHRTIENVVLHVKRKVLNRHPTLFLCLCAASQENCMIWWDTRICCPSDPSCATFVEVQRSTEDILGCTTNRSSRAYLDWAGRRSIGCLPLWHQAC